jgi:flagella basal body P-ring formation protein FlgA
MLVPDLSFAQSEFAADLSVAPQVDAEVIFILKESADISNERLLFSDIAECQGTKVVCEETYAVDMGETPQPGRTAILAADKIAAVLSTEWPDLKFTMTGARFVRVQAGVQEVKDDAIESSLIAELENNFTQDETSPGNFRITLERVVSKGSHRLRPGEFQVVFPELNGDIMKNAVAAKRFFGARQRRVQVEYINGKTVSRDVITAEFSVMEFLPVATNDLLRGQMVKEDDFRMVWTPTNRDAGKYVTSMKSAVGRKIKRAIIAGRPIEPSQLEISLVARRGQTATLLIQKGDMVIQGQVKLLANGGYGQVVEAQYLTTKKKVRVRVVDSDTVQMVF